MALIRATCSNKKCREDVDLERRNLQILNLEGVSFYISICPKCNGLAIREAGPMLIDLLVSSEVPAHNLSWLE